MMWTLGANMQPSTTKPLRLTEMHMVVVWTCGAWITERKKSVSEVYVNYFEDGDLR